MARVQRKTIAAALGVDAAIITRDARRGMPVHSIEAARAWREQHVRPRSAPPPDDPPARRLSPGRMLAYIDELADATHPGDVEALRAAIALLPPEMWTRVRLAVETWKLLLGPKVLADLSAEVPADAPVDDEVAGEALCLAIVAPFRYA